MYHVVLTNLSEFGRVPLIISNAELIESHVTDENILFEGSFDECSDNIASRLCHIPLTSPYWFVVKGIKYVIDLSKGIKSERIYSASMDGVVFNFHIDEIDYYLTWDMFKIS